MNTAKGENAPMGDWGRRVARSTSLLVLYRDRCAPVTGAVVFPETYLDGSGSVVVAMLLLGVILTFAFNPGVVEDNPIRDALGYSNPCARMPPFNRAAGPCSHTGSIWRMDRALRRRVPGRPAGQISLRRAP